MKTIFVVIFFFTSLSAFSQGIDNLWLMGYRGGGGGVNLNFNGGALVISSQVNRIMNFCATNGVICDRNGNLLFCSNGLFVANAFNDTMMGGSGLNPSVYDSIYEGFGDGVNIPQANLIVPIPGDSTKYYLFHETDDDWYGNDYSFYFYYSVVDMTQDSGKGAVMKKNVVLMTDSFVGGFLTACKHANGRDWWVMNHQANTNTYFKYLITPSIIQGPDTQSIGSVRNSGNFGQMVFSPDGNKAAMYDPFYDLDIMDFDRCTGSFSNLIHVDFNDGAELGGVAFSPNSKVLYVSSDTIIYQFDLTSSDIPATQTIVAVYDEFKDIYNFPTTFGPAQLAPDGKIYIACGNSTVDIHVINYPDSVGVSCDACQHCIPLPADNFLTIANHPNYFLGPDSGSVCDSLEGVSSYSVSSFGLKMFPNPIVEDNEVTFSYGVSSTQSILDIYNVNGQCIAHYSLPQWSSVQHLTLPSLSSGIYLARLTQGNATASVKFLKE